jgi:nucleotide-binding universal stress UspA family protein
MIRCVLLATDGSDAACAAVRTAIDLTQSLGPDARLHVASVVDYVEVPSVLGKHPPSAPDLLSEQAEEALNDAAAGIRKAGLEVETHLLHGDVVDALLECAAEVGADILIAGAQGLNPLVRLVMGSAVARLVRSTTLPVVVVRA